MKNYKSAGISHFILLSQEPLISGESALASGLEY